MHDDVHDDSEMIECKHCHASSLFSCMPQNKYWEHIMLI